MKKFTISGYGNPNVGDTVSYTGTQNGSSETGLTHKIWYYVGTKCGDSEGKLTYTGADGNITVSYALEGGAIYCGDNQ